MVDSIQAVWVIGQYDGYKLKQIRELADNGICYLQLHDTTGAYAFLWVLDAPIPHHLVEVTDLHMIADLNKRRAYKQGAHIRTTQPKQMKSIADVRLPYKH